MRILGIDPGTTESGFVYLDNGKIEDSGFSPNEVFRHYLKVRLGFIVADAIAIEMIASYGMPVGKETFETCLWIGRFMELAKPPVRLVYRKDIKMHLCGSMKAKDGNVMQALKDKYGPKGTKANPGPLYGISKHLWSALAVADYYASL